jgi:hypothetical protein
MTYAYAVKQESLRGGGDGATPAVARAMTQFNPDSTWKPL